MTGPATSTLLPACLSSKHNASRPPTSRSRELRIPCSSLQSTRIEHAAFTCSSDNSKIEDGSAASSTSLTAPSVDSAIL